MDQQMPDEANWTSDTVIMPHAGCWESKRRSHDTGRAQDGGERDERPAGHPDPAPPIPITTGT